MLRTVGGVLLIAHALITAAVWVSPLLPNAPFNPAHSWLLGDSRNVSVPTSIALAVALAGTGLGLLLNQAWWAPLGLASGICAALFTVVYIHPWLSLAIAINAGIALIATQHLTPA